MKTFWLCMPDNPDVRLEPDNRTLPMSAADAFNLAVWALRGLPTGRARIVQFGEGDAKEVCHRDVEGRWHTGGPT